MNKETKIKQVLAAVLIIFLSAVFLCGCTEHSIISNGVDLSKFLGTWEGNMETSMFGFGFRENGTVGNMTEFRQNMTGGNITKLEFTVDTLYMTITIGNETQTISQTYTIEGDQLILSMQFTGERPDWMQHPSDGEPPLFNDSERPPFDGERPFGGEPPFDGERPSRTRSYTYRFNEDNTILYLDESSFFKL